MIRWPFNERPKENPGKAPAILSNEARARRARSDRDRFHAMARELCACTGQAVPTPLKD